MFNLTSPTLDAPSHNNCYEVTSCKLWVVQGWSQWLVWQWLKAAAVEAYLHTLQCYEHTRHYTYYWWRWHTWSSCWAAVCSKVGGWLPGWDCTSAHQPALHQQAARWARTCPVLGEHTPGPHFRVQCTAPVCWVGPHHVIPVSTLKSCDDALM